MIPDNCTITVINDDRLSILNSERSKKKKTNTPKSTDDLYKQDEIGHQSKKSLSEMLDQMEIARESEDDDDSNDLKYLVTILPDVIDKLKEHGQVEIYKKWCTLVKDDTFLLDNICYLLFLDLIT